MPGETKREIRPYSCISRRWRSMNNYAQRTTSQRVSLPIEASSQRRTDIRGLAIALSSCQSQVLCPTRKSRKRQTSKTKRRNNHSYNKVTGRLNGEGTLATCRYTGVSKHRFYNRTGASEYTAPLAPTVFLVQQP